MTEPLFETHARGLSWLADPAEAMQRASHALVGPDRAVWVIDPVDVEGLDGRIAALGQPTAVVQLLDRHRRDCAAVADRLGVELVKLPFDGLASSPFEVIAISRSRWWREVALWWPEQRLLVIAEALGTCRFFRSGEEPVGVHPLRRVRPPRGLAALGPLHLLCGHGRPIEGPEVAASIEDAVANAGRRIPGAVRALIRAG